MATFVSVTVAFSESTVKWVRRVTSSNSLIILENLLILNYFHNINLFLDIHNSDTILLGPSTNNAYMYYPLPFLLSPPLHSTPVTQATQSVGMYKIATANTQGSRFLGPIIAESPKRI